jgi:hypothetical protein
MFQDTQRTSMTQAKICQYTEKIGAGTSRPERKFVHDMIYGLLKSGTPQLGSIARSLGEPVSVKKRTERFSRHLRKDGLWETLQHGYLEAQKEKLGKCPYFLVDTTDISKRYGTKHEGQAGVHDGSEQGTGYGYPMVTIVGVGEGRSDVVPAYSELYSLNQESTSENKKLLDAIDAVAPFASKDAVFVIDRGGDRARIFEHLDKESLPYIVRMNNNRHLWTDEGKDAIWKVARDTPLPYALTMIRQGKNRKKEIHLRCGARRVTRTKDGAPVWLVSAQYAGPRGGRFYFLTSIECETEAQLVTNVLRGYHARWIIEEVHREIKEDLHLESIRLFDYTALKTMSSLVWIAAGFYYTKLAGLESMDILLDMAQSIVYRLKLKEITGFVYYKLFRLINSLLQPTIRRRRTVFTQITQRQLSFL